MFIERQQYPSIEFDPAVGQQEPNLVHYFSNKVDPFKSILPLLVEPDETERVVIVTSPLSQVVDETIRIHRHEAYHEMVVVDEKYRAFFHAVKSSLQQALAKIELIQFSQLDDEHDET